MLGRLLVVGVLFFGFLIFRVPNLYHGPFRDAVQKWIKFLLKTIICCIHKCFSLMQIKRVTFFFFLVKEESLLKLRHFPSLTDVFRKLQFNEVRENVSKTLSRRNLSESYSWFFLRIIGKACFHRKLKAAVRTMVNWKKCCKEQKPRHFAMYMDSWKSDTQFFWYIRILIKSAKYRLCNMKEFQLGAF